jgi:putative iron-dependent peroxidase
MSTVYTAQAGIFALGTASHAYLEFDACGNDSRLDLVGGAAALREPRTTMGGVNLVAGFRPELWREAAPDHAPQDVRGFDEDVVGADGFRMPATQHDAFLWLSGGSYDVVFDTARAVIAELGQVGSVATETSCWPYHRDLDLTGFVDGTENPPLTEAPESVLVPPGVPGAGGSVLLLQKWAHDADAWESLDDESQEKVIGRTKSDSIELDARPEDSHVARTDQETFGTIFRRNMPYGTVTDHGTLFVGFCAEQPPLQRMLVSMAGTSDRPRDALTRYTRPLSGAYYVVPALEALRALSAGRTA